MKKILFVVVIVISYCIFDIKGDVIIDTINNNGDINISCDELESGYQYIKEKKEVINLNKLSIKEHFEHYLKQGLSDNDAMKSVAKDRGVSKNVIYKEIKC